MAYKKIKNLVADMDIFLPDAFEKQQKACEEVQKRAVATA
jgi:hypothetical protein